jgi:branched-chain amino acid transport system ATP-binding protein
MLEAHDLHVSFGPVEAVRGVSLVVKPGRVTLVLGANGAGKTSTLRAVAGLHSPRRGEVMLDGAPVTGLPAHKMVRRGVVLVPEGRRVFSPLTVAENLRLGAYTTKSEASAQRISEVHEMFPVLRDRANGPAGLLSGGEQQMLAFGRALMAEPRVMLMDEPSMGLAPTVVDSVLSSVRRMADAGLGILIVEQNAQAGLDLADDVLVLARGRVVFSGPATDARANSSVLAAFLGEAALTGQEA